MLPIHTLERLPCFHEKWVRNGKPRGEVLRTPGFGVAHPGTSAVQKKRRRPPGCESLSHWPGRRLTNWNEASVACAPGSLFQILQRFDQSIRYLRRRNLF